MVTARSREELIAVPVTVASLFVLVSTMLLLRRVQILINWNNIVTGRRCSFLLHKAFVHFDGQLFNVIDRQVGNRLLSFASGYLCQACDANQKSGLAHTLLMLLREHLEEVADG